MPVSILMSRPESKKRQRDTFEPPSFNKNITPFDIPNYNAFGFHGTGGLQNSSGFTFHDTVSANVWPDHCTRKQVSFDCEEERATAVVGKRRQMHKIETELHAKTVAMLIQGQKEYARKLRDQQYQIDDDDRDETMDVNDPEEYNEVNESNIVTQKPFWPELIKVKEGNGTRNTGNGTGGGNTGGRQSTLDCFLKKKGSGNSSNLNNPQGNFSTSSCSNYTRIVSNTNSQYPPGTVFCQVCEKQLFVPSPDHLRNIQCHSCAKVLCELCGFLNGETSNRCFDCQHS